MITMCYSVCIYILRSRYQRKSNPLIDTDGEDESAKQYQTLAHLSRKERRSSSIVEDLRRVEPLAGKSR